MIKSDLKKLDNANVTIDGTVPEIMTDLAYIISAIERLDMRDKLKEMIYLWIETVTKSAKKGELTNSLDMALEKLNEMDSDPDGGVFDE